MRGIIIVSGLVVCGTAAVAAARPCDVSIVRAPEAVRGVVERWVQGEPSCSGPLEVRIVETERGLYVVATDAAQRTFDRVVPDAESAGALIVSWAVAATPTVAPDRVALVEPPAAAGPSAVDEAEPAVASTRARDGRLFAIGANLGATTVIGDYVFDDLSFQPNLHGELDLLQHGRWSVGVAAGMSGKSDDLTSNFSLGATGYGAWTTAPSTWRFRGRLGIGVDHLWIWGNESFDYYQSVTMVPIGLDLRISRQVTERWAIAAGPAFATLAPLVPRSFTGNVGTSMSLDVALQGAL